MISLKIIGFIKRKCPRCGFHRDLINYIEHKENKLLCYKCMFEIHGIGKIVDKIEDVSSFDFCRNCQKLSLKKTSSRITDSHVITKFHCKKCGDKKTKRIRKWKKMLN